jgi:hypothetical protein
MIAEALALWHGFWIPLLAGHFVGDFMLQTDEIVSRKGEMKVATLHAGVVAAVSWALTGQWGSVWWLVPLLLLTHAAVDLTKIRLDGLLAGREGCAGDYLERNGRLILFLADQAVHLLVLLGVVLLLDGIPALQATVVGPGAWVGTFGPDFLNFLVLIIGWILATSASGYTLALALSRFEAELSSRQKAGLRGGGYWIGITERSLIYLFILLGEPAGIGFLAAAKSVFRIGEIKEAEDRKLAEYILIGTLMSFATAMLVAIGTRQALLLLS